MDMENVRKIVVIKNVASNYIEEAIFILRSDCRADNNLLKKDRLLYGKLNNDKDYLIKEAQLIINNYINECKKNGISYANSNIHDMKVHKAKLSVNTIINIALFSSFALLLFFLIKVFF